MIFFGIKPYAKTFLDYVHVPIRCHVHGYNTKNASSTHVPKCATNIRLF